MNLVTIYTARDSADAVMISKTLTDLGFDVLEPGDSNVFGGGGGMDPLLNFFPIQVPEEQANEARKALAEMGFETEGGDEDNGAATKAE
ncbi:MAG: hypothetical protein NTW86_25660 [Candidatus Sumerlaeota bacterium]|nr:hypothetical protein [Candidatus Sumerlaeota bacterium]